MEILNYQVSDGQSGIRIDRYLSEMNEELSRSYIQKLLKEQKITVNGSAVKANYKVQEGDEISVAVPDIKEPDILPEDIPLDILYEDDDVLIVNKPKGMVVHPSAGHTSGTLVNAIMFHCKDNLSGINGVLRPGIVHRIDKDTTGALLVCKNDNAHRNLAEQLKEHSIRRRYRAIVAGVLKEDEGTIEGPIGRHPIDRKKMAVNYKNGKDAVTHYKVLERFKNATYVECRLETGRTHQIRVHMTSIGHPLLVLDSNTFYSEVSKDLHEKYTASQLKAMIKFESIEDTEVFKAIVVSPSPYESKEIGDSIAKIAPKIIANVKDNAKLKIVDEADTPKVPTSPNVTRNTIIAFLGGLILALIISFVRDFLDVKIKYNEEMTTILDLPILAAIPDFEYFSNQKNANKYGNRYGK